MQFLKRHSFLFITILIVLGAYLFFRSDQAVAPTNVSDDENSEQSSEVDNSADKALTDDDLLTYAKSSFDKAEMMGKDIIIGKHKDIAVRANFPCSDVCPDSTIRIIHYDIDPKLANMCNMVGGEVKSILVPIAITVRPQEFCFPKPIIESGIYEFVEKKA